MTYIFNTNKNKRDEGWKLAVYIKEKKMEKNVILACEQKLIYMKQNISTEPSFIVERVQNCKV
jgi:hypothetical protein